MTIFPFLFCNSCIKNACFFKTSSMKVESYFHHFHTVFHTVFLFKFSFRLFNFSNIRSKFSFFERINRYFDARITYLKHMHVSRCIGSGYFWISWSPLSSRQSRYGSGNSVLYREFLLCSFKDCNFSALSYESATFLMKWLCYRKLSRHSQTLVSGMPIHWILPDHSSIPHRQITSSTDHIRI